MRRDVVLGWQMDTNSGWGVVGVNLFSQLAHDLDFRPISRGPISYGMFMGMDPLRVHSLVPACDESNKCTDWSGIMLDPVGNDLEGHYDSDLSIGRCIVEWPDWTKAQDKLSRFDALLTASTWNKNRLEDATGRTVKLIHEGIDETLFYPGPKAQSLPEGFYVYSCGKVEGRKAQDIVMLAFKAFSERHEDARLVTLWQSPFNEIANGFTGKTDKALWMDDSGSLKIKQWAYDLGINPDKIIDLNQCPNFLVPNILRNMDVMLAPSRVESCTSLPVKEAMACGVPIIAAMHTGMLDLLTQSNSWPLTKFTDIPGHADWKEPDLDEIDFELEHIYQHRSSCRRRALDTSTWIRENRTWKKHVSELKEWIKTLYTQDSSV